MSPLPPASDPGKRPTADVELNLAPIIDCFTVLITYLLVSASFLAVSSVDAGIAVFRSSASTPANASDSVTLEIRVLDGGRIAFALHGRATPPLGLLDPLDGAGSLSRRLDTMLRAVPTLSEATVSAAPAVPYVDVVRAVELTKKYFAKVYLSAGGH